MEIGTSWSSLALPSTLPDNFYMFGGWFDENGNRMQNAQTINADQTYTARFIPIGISDDNILAMPDAGDRRQRWKRESERIRRQ